MFLRCMDAKSVLDLSFRQLQLVLATRTIAIGWGQAALRVRCLSEVPTSKVVAAAVPWRFVKNIHVFDETHC